MTFVKITFLASMIDSALNTISMANREVNHGAAIELLAIAESKAHSALKLSDECQVVGDEHSTLVLIDKARLVRDQANCAQIERAVSQCYDDSRLARRRVSKLTLQS